ncbi:MAG: TonB-dependent receptor [Deltaproteobacteria bacterium]|nr:TonB-dependent receptor [Deltaproteobacteria bacterium]
MKRTCRSLNVIVFAGVWTVLALPDILPGATTCDPWVAKIVSAQGNVEVRRAGETQWQPARLNDTFCAGDRIQVGETSRADVALINQPVLRLDQNTTISLGGVKEQRTSLVELVKGALYFFSRLPRNVEIITAFVNAGVEGTEGLVRVDADRTVISIFEGTVLAVNPAGTLTLSDGESAVAEQGRAPVLTVVVRPRDAVQWALYYQPTVYFRPEEFQAGPGWQGMVRNSIEAYIKSDFQAAFDSIKGVPDTLAEPRFFAYRASLLLAVGRLDEASQDIDRALRLNSTYSDALALQSVIAVAQNEKEKALDLARRAVAADPRSASALIALSYAQQANFDLEGALTSLREAVQAAPDNALAWARLAEIWLSFGRLSEALEAAQKTVALNPDLSRTQTVLGFAYLTQIRTADSKKAFERAIELDQADPLPRLGLGLAKIREGDLLEGRREIDIAVSLNPDNALIRSYLGKAYFEEKRDQQAVAQYHMAKEFDPRDPTAYFYDAIRKQTTNRPVEALQDMQRAIELNDNRAVYRSRLLLDSDLAARSASLGRIYSDLGFQQLALVEGWKSVNTDPTNFSAHRFLADSYSVLPRHEIARVSELLQSQLLQPLNMTPIQPHLAESNLFLISSGGPAALSFNEFNPLFNRNGVTFQTTGLAGENKTYAGEGVLSGIYRKAAFSLGGFHFQSDGWRKNADQRDNVGNAFLQLELSPQSSIQAELRRRETKVGDLRQRFFPEDFFPGRRDTSDSFTVRFGGRHSFSPDSIILGSFVFQDKTQRVSDDSPVAPVLTSVDIRRPQDAVSVELQHLLRSRYFSLASGLGYFDVNEKLRTKTGTIFPPPLDLVATTTDTGVQHVNAYTYANINLLKDFTVAAGASFDYLKGDPAFIPGGDEAQFNPKFGISWNPFSGTSVRAAVSRIVKRTLITDQTLEPTQVAGFNQFFDDPEITKAWRYGGAIDQKFTKDLFGGLEFSKRDLEIPLVDASVSPTRTRRLDGKEYLGRAYLFWTPHEWLALRAEYSYERFRNDPLLEEPKKLNTHRIPLGINFVHPSGVSASLTATYYNQEGKLVRLTTGPESASDDFWSVDAAVNYRLPRRYGFITVGATNLLDNKFKFFEADRNNPRIQPDRMVFLKMTLALP